MKAFVCLSVLATVMLVSGCQTMPPIQTVEYVDIERFMGDWYVIAHIPAFIEKEAYNALESYSLNEDGTIQTTYTFNKGGPGGPRKEYNPKGFVRESSANAVWGMQFIWPFKAEYRIIYLNEDYTQTVIGRTQRDYLWIMARSPSIPKYDYQEILDFVRSQGYDISEIRKVPHES
jgi:apolipoprotein D and lipocalin family protein